MGMIHWFRKVAYAQVILGVIAYAVAEQNAAMVLAAGALSTLSWYVVEGPGGKPLPRWMINLGVLLATGWLFFTQAPPARAPLIMSLGEFILCIQLLKMYELKKNRDWAQLMVLSLMQMICASIISAEIIYGLLLVAYLILTLLTVLLFQLKIGHDEVLEAAAKQAPINHPTVGPRPLFTRGHRRHFNLLAAACGITCIGISTCVFIAMPRGRGGGMLGDWQAPTRHAESGFENKVELGSGHITTSRVPILNVRLMQGDRDIGSREYTFLLRGSALDEYDPRTHRWTRSRAAAKSDIEIAVERETPVALADPARFRGRDLVKQFITLRAGTKGVLLAAFQPVRLQSDALKSASFSARDQVLGTRQTTPDGFQYTIDAIRDENLSDAYLARWSRSFAPPAIEGGTVSGAAHTLDFNWSAYARNPVVEDPRVRSLTESVMSAAKLRRAADAEWDPIDLRIAATVERYLQSQYSYTLDLPEMRAGAEPICTFLFENRRGHCEYFASAMCSMLRSVGLRSRVITGVRATEYNPVGGYYVVRQKNAHAWVEVWDDNAGWRTFDPSPQASIEELQRPGNGLLASIRDFYEYLEFQWINNVITYDDLQRNSVIVNIDQNLSGLTAMARRIAAFFEAVAAALHQYQLMGAIGYLALGAAFLLVIALTWLLVRRIMRRRSAIRQLQLDAVSRRDQRRLARQLDFYLNMLRILDRAGHSKPIWQTPAHFAARLVTGHPDRFTAVVPLTDLFYEIRFGGRPLDSTRARLIQQHLDQLRRSL